MQAHRFKGITRALNQPPKKSWRTESAGGVPGLRDATQPPVGTPGTPLLGTLGAEVPNVASPAPLGILTVTGKGVILIRMVASWSDASWPELTGALPGALDCTFAPQQLPN